MLRGAVLKFCPTTVEVSSYRGCKPLANWWLADLSDDRYRVDMFHISDRCTLRVALILALTSAALMIGTLATLVLGVAPAPLLDVTTKAAEFIR